MKKLTAYMLCTASTILLSISHVVAQTDKLLHNYIFEAKEDLHYSGYNANNERHKIPATYVGSKVMYSFIKSFKNGDDAEWFTSGNDYLAIFNLDGRPTRAFFAKNGYLFFTASYDYEESLPHEIIKTIKSNYVDYIIGRVSEVTTNNQTAWIINLQDENDLIIVKVMDGALMN